MHLASSKYASKEEIHFSFFKVLWRCAAPRNAQTLVSAAHIRIRIRISLFRNKKRSDLIISINM